MTNNPENPPEVEQFPERIGDDYEMWQRYYDVHGKEAYGYRRLYEAASADLVNLYTFVEEHGIDLPHIPDYAQTASPFTIELTVCQAIT